MEGQMSIFDLMVSKDFPETEEEMARQVGLAVGLKFEYSEFYERWIAKKKGIKYELYYGQFVPGVNDGKQYIGLDVTYPSLGGFGCPCDGIEHVIWSIKRTMKAHEEGKV